MILVDWQIKQEIEKGLTDPRWIPLVNTSSMDVTIGKEALLLVSPRKVLACRDYGNSSNQDSVGNIFASFQLTKNSIFDPEERVLVEIEQDFVFPPTISGQFHLKSSRAREFYDHKLAGWIDGGFKGKLTLELINHSCDTLPLYQGLRIGQITFFSHQMPLTPYQGKYQNSQTVSISKDNRND